MNGLKDRIKVSSVGKDFSFSISSHFERELERKFRYLSLGKEGRLSKFAS